MSIVIPAYNHAGYLEQAIRSVLAQDYPSLELIVLDDGSTDATRDVLARYSGMFHWETQQNMGQAMTLNKGWQMAKGDILSYLSADDALEPRAASCAVQCLDANPDVVLTYCNFNLIDPGSQVIRQVSAPDFDYRKMVSKLACPPGPGAFFRRTALETAGLWDSSLRQMPDYDFWLRVGLQGRFQRIPAVLASFRVHEASQTFSRTDEARAAEPVTIISRFFESQRLPEDLARLKNEALGSAHVLSAQLHLRAGRYRCGYENLKQAFALHPAGLFTAHTARMAANAIFNRIGHRAVWTLKRLLPRRAGQ